MTVANRLNKHNKRGEDSDGDSEAEGDRNRRNPDLAIDGHNLLECGAMIDRMLTMSTFDIIDGSGSAIMTLVIMFIETRDKGFCLFTTQKRIAHCIRSDLLRTSCTRDEEAVIP